MGEKVICSLCGLDDLKQIYHQDNSRIYRCQNCGFVFRFPKFSSKQIQEMYDSKQLLENTYFSGLKKNYDQKNPAVLMYQRELKKIDGKIKKDKVLDIGCAYGAFLDIARNKGFEPYGVEISEKSSLYAKNNFNLNVFTGTLEQAKYPSNNFSLVTLWDVLEHLPEPIDTLKEIYRILEKNGMVLILTINSDSLIGKMANLTEKTKGFLYDYQHLNFYSEKTLKESLKKAGFQNILTLDKLGAQISRWQSREIPLYLEVGVNFLDLIAKPLGIDYRQVVIAFK